MVDVSEKDFYILDIFRVAGGSDHARFMHSHFGRITTQGLSLSKADDYGYNTQMRSFLVDHNPNPGWSADWAIDDKYKYLPDGSDIHLRYTDLSFDTEAYTCEAWVSPGGFEIDKDLWIPCLMLRRRANDKLLISTFAGIIEPYEGRSNITGIRRLRLENCADTYLAIEVSLANGARDIIIAADTESPLSSKATFPELLYQPDLQIRLRGEICMIRYDNKELRTICLCNAESIETDEVTLTLKGRKSCEIQFA